MVTLTSRQLDALEPILHGAMARILQELDEAKKQQQQQHVESPAPSTPEPGGSEVEVVVAEEAPKK